MEDVLKKIEELEKKFNAQIKKVEETEVVVKKLTDKFDALNTYLTQNGEIVIDLVMRIAALERTLIAKEIITDELFRDEVSKTYAELVKKATESGALNAS